jgi:hypothetical protein
MANTCDSPAIVDKRKGRKKKPPEDWRGQIGMGVGERLRGAEPESSVLQKVTEALWAQGGVEVMRNNVGAIKKGRRYIKYGLGKGSSDLVCIVAPYGRWLCIETKRPKGGVVDEDQRKWLAKMKTYGAIVAVCTSPDEVRALVEQARRPA